MPPHGPITRRRRDGLRAAAVALPLCVVGAGCSHGAAPPGPRPVAQVRAQLGAPDPGEGLEAVLSVDQSVVPGALLGRLALPAGPLRGRLWVRARDAWRMEVQGDGHDWQLAREGDLLRLYSSASQTAYTLGTAVIPDGLAAVGPVEVGAAQPAVVAGRPAYRVVYRPRGDGLLLDSVAVTADARTGVPLDLRVIAVGRPAPVLRITATRVTATAVPAVRIRVRAPRNGSTVPLDLLLAAGRATGGVQVVGSGWGRALRLPLSSGAAAGVLDGLGRARDRSAPARRAVSTALLSALSDGRSLLVGPVTLERLEALS